MKTTIIRTIKLYLLTAILVCAVIILTGCSEPRMSSTAQVGVFETAGPFVPQVDIDKLLVAKTNHGTYTVGKGDVLELQMPTILTAVSPKLYRDQMQQVLPYMARVSESGTITLPIIGQMNVEGKTQGQIENEIFNAYYPKYLVVQPSVVCNIKEYYVRNITIVGAVTQPGVYQLKSNEMSLINALMKAGGIVEGGASVIIIKNPLRKYMSPQANNEVKQFADLGSDTDFSSLEFELVFKPNKNSPAKGTLIIQRGKNAIHTKKINIQNRDERTKYVKELQQVVGTEQAHIIGQAIEQLAGQFAPAITANQLSQTDIDVTDEELLETANDADNSGVKKQDIEIKEIAGDNQIAKAVPENDIETPAVENTEPTQTAEAANSVENINNETPAIENAEEPIINSEETAKAVEENTQAGDSINNEQPAENKVEPQETEIADVAKADEAETDEIGAVISDDNGRAAAAAPADKSVDDFASAAPAQVKPQNVPPITGVDEAIVLPVKGLNIPFADAPLMEGDLIEVRKLNPSVFTVIGLAKTPGAFPYPPDAEYNLMQAIGFAGGVDMIADPRFVSVYRQDSKGEIVSAVFRIDQKFMARSCNVKIKPGDVISIDVTPRTKRNVLLHQILRLNFGVFISPNIMGGNND